MSQAGAGMPRQKKGSESVTSRLPFSSEEFLEVFQLYHAGTWPAVWIIHAGALAALFWITRPGRAGARRSAQFPLLFLGGIWVWIGVAYQLSYFSVVNPAARLFALLFAWQGAWFLVEAYQSSLLIRSWGKDPISFTSAFLIFYSLVVYPLLGMQLGHAYPRGPIFGLPCPTTIFTFGILILIEGEGGIQPRRLLVLPALWTIIGSTAAVRFGILEDLMLPASAIAVLILLRRRKTPAEREV